MKKIVDRLVEEFSDFEYAHDYMESQRVTRIAAQIHALRKARGWSQQQLAAKAGLAQERVSKIENGDFESITMKTLQRFARAFDIDLRIAFTPFRDGILDVTQLSNEKLQVRDRTTDLGLFKAQLRAPQLITIQACATTRSTEPAPLVKVDREWHSIQSAAMH